MNKGYLCLVTLPGITCGVVVSRGKVISAPPVVKGCKGWEIKRFGEWIKNKGGSIRPLCRIILSKGRRDNWHLTYLVQSVKG